MGAADAGRIGGAEAVGIAEVAVAAVGDMDFEQEAFVATVVLEGMLVAASLVLGSYSDRERC